MLREELTEKLSAFESKRLAGQWLWHGWRVWPAIRTRLALSLHGVEARPGRPGVAARLSGALAWRRQKLSRRLGERFQAAPALPADVVFLSHSDRGQRLGGRLYNTVVDPWAEALICAGSRVSVWERGDPRGPGLVPHASIQWALDRALHAHGSLSEGQAPVWFEELSDWAATELEADVDWSTLRRDLAAIDLTSQLFRVWLSRAAPRALVVDCWYGREAMGASLAAHQLGIPVIDLQHGVQGHGHPAYAGWSPPPNGCYETFPNRFWVWGEWDAKALVANNPSAIAPESVSVVGQRWLSEWTHLDNPRHRQAHARAARLVGGRRAVLVTLQDGVPYREALLPMIREAPGDWLWLVRLHRRVNADPRRLEAELSAATGRSIDVADATRLPLHALLQASSWHVTGFSTCALEALAFGVPSLLTHESGSHAYAPFVAERVMWPHRSPEQSARLLNECSPQLGDACRRASRRVFAEPADAPGLLREFQR